MANDEKIGCSVGKTILVDPNDFDGHDSSSNMSVPLEDLSISVELTTERKARTILLQTKEKGTAESSSDVRISFIEGTQIGGEKVLTTSFTDLTTSFDSDNDPEGLGITSIDIDFNSSYAPLITINFIDIRGTAIFQNEDNVGTGKNKYATFFQLPYPLFQLKVKGYYGMPVSYCLHMTKFTSRFNSQTGNFEITASFIGYTYAMLSDMLLGFLKAIPYTKLGEDKYKSLIATEPNLIANDGTVLTLNGLIDAINAINVNSQKIASDDPDVANIKKAESKHSDLDALKTNVYMLGGNLDSILHDEYQFIVLNEKLSSTEIDKFIADYKSSVSENLKKYNADDNKFGLKEEDFNLTKKYTNLTLNLLASTKPEDISTLQGIFGSDLTNSEFSNLRIQIYGHVTRDGAYGFPADKKFTIYNLMSIYSTINEKHNQINKYVDSLQTDVAKKIRASIASTLGFDPTVRNMINVFTVAAEVFLSVIYKVSEAAKTNPARTIQLEKFKQTIDTSYDYKKSSNSVQNSDGVALEANYYPWPDYREIDDKNGLVEKYLGGPFILDIPKDVNELNFIDDLLAAFIKSKEAEDKSALAMEALQENWVGANPIDTRLFGNTKFPYERIEGLDYKEIIRLMMIRFMTYVFSNRNLTAAEIQAIAKVELDSALKWSVNAKAVEALGQAKAEYFKDSEGKINDEIKKVIGGPASSSYFYTYIGGTNTIDETSVNDKHFIPINDRFTGTWKFGDYQDPSIPSGVNSRNAGSLFLSNYGQTKFDSSTGILKKEDDGAYYLKVLTPEKYAEFSSYPTPVGATPSILSLEALKKDWKEWRDNPDLVTTAGFNLLGGAYGVQEFFQLDWGDESLKGLPFRYLFYGDGIVDSTPTNKTNGLALKRKYSTNSMLDKLKGVEKDDKSGFIAALTKGGTATEFDTSWPGFNVVQFRIPKGSSSDNSLQSYMNTVDDNEKEGIDLWATSNLRAHSRYGETRVLANLLEQGSSEVCYPYINFQVRWSHPDDAQQLAPVSLFGSRFYYAQTNDYSRALLFLHTFPWNGLINDKDDSGSSFSANDTIFDKPEIYNAFGQRAGFVSTPMLWTAFIGAMLWRADYSEPEMNPITEDAVQIGGGSGPNDPIIFVNGNEALIPGMKANSFYPTKLEFLTKRYPKGTLDNEWRVLGGKAFRKTQMTFDPTLVIDTIPADGFRSRQYKYLGETLLGLPEQAKNEFKKAFFDFVAGDFKRVRQELEVVTSSSSLISNEADWKSKYNTIKSSITTAPTSWTSYFGDKVVKVADMKALYKSFDNYIIFAQLYEFGSGIDFSVDNYDYNYVMEIKDDSPASELLLNLFKKESIIANTSFLPWGSDGYSAPNESELQKTGDKTKSIYINESKYNVFVDTLLLALKEVKDGLSESAKKKQTEQEIFGTADENAIKLQLYRTCKNIYDKWIGGSNDADNVIFQCGGRNSLDRELVLKRTNNLSSAPKLIDSFRFVTRSFRDIGDEMVINPVPVIDILRDNPNTSFYDAVTSLLSSNNFDFIPLPSYINYGDPKELSALFKPMATYDAIAAGTVGPSFVCVYVGQKSKHLEAGESEYTGDGFDIRCKDGKFDKSLPLDFTTNADKHENNVAVFAVNYSQQNQNIFKDITLDQSEFSETAESLQIIDDISKKGSENNKTLAGQNMYNVYAVRSYKTEVEMMGNAMIQPMMYFQLNNIPMFHGAYMITHVKHSIKPNYMSTHFTGVRIRNVETELIDVKDLFMSLIDSITNSNVTATVDAGAFGTAGSSTTTNSGSPRGKYPPIVNTIINNGGVNGKVVSGNITVSPMGNVVGIKNLKLNDAHENNILTEAVVPLTNMLNDWVAWMKSNGFAGNNGYYAYITSMFRDYEKQVQVKKEMGDAAASPGTSPHGWAMAVDFQFFTKNGTIIRNKRNTKSSFEPATNPALQWLLDNSYKYGWILPIGLRDGGGLDEHWHFEYHGTAALCLYQKNPVTYGYVAKVSDPVKDFVKNPKTKDGVADVYQNCDYTQVKQSDGVEVSLGNAADFWSLVAICSLEASGTQPRADVAQSIYNRLALPKQLYGHTIKEIVTAKGQFEPTFKNRGEWLMIDNLSSAIVAVKNSKGWTDEKAKAAIKETRDAILNTTLQNNSKSFIGTRTSFRDGIKNVKTGVTDTVERNPADQNNIFFWEDGGKKMIGQPVPNPPDWVALRVDTSVDSTSNITSPPNQTPTTQTTDITISLPPVTNTAVHVFVFYPGIAINGKKGREYMPPLIKSAVPSWYNNYVIVIPNEHTTDWETVQKQFLAKMKEKGLTVKTLNLGIYSGSGNASASIMKNISNLKLNNLILMDPYPNTLPSKMSGIKAKGTKVYLEYNPKNWGGTLNSSFATLATAVGPNVYNTNASPSDHNNMPVLTLTRYKTLIEATL